MTKSKTKKSGKGQGRVGQVIIGVIFLAAVFAPLISCDRPLWLYRSFANGRWTLEYPLFSSLFDIRFFESGVDLFFNTLMVLSPAMLLLWIAIKKKLGHRKRFKLWFVAGAAAAQLIVFILVWTNPSSLPARNYKAEIANMEASGERPTYAFPIFRWSYREVDLSKAHPLGLSSEHPLGTDKVGRDILARMVYGARVSLSIGAVAVAIYLLVGIVIGALAGYLGGKIDMIVSRLIEVMMCFPVFFLVLTVSAFVENRSIFHIMLIIGLTGWTKTARLVRGEFIRERSLGYVQAAVALGFSRARIAFMEILPNALRPVLVSAVFGVAGAIMYESALSFLGLSDPVAPSWGGILATGRAELCTRLILIPGVAIFTAVAALNLAGEALDERFNPKVR